MWKKITSFKTLKKNNNSKLRFLLARDLRQNLKNQKKNMKKKTNLRENRKDYKIVWSICGSV